MAECARYWKLGLKERLSYSLPLRKSHLAFDLSTTGEQGHEACEMGAAMSICCLVCLARSNTIPASGEGFVKHFLTLDSVALGDNHRVLGSEMHPAARWEDSLKPFEEQARVIRLLGLFPSVIVDVVKVEVKTLEGAGTIWPRIVSIDFGLPPLGGLFQMLEIDGDVEGIQGLA